jgi:hypothetical protein
MHDLKPLILPKLVAARKSSQTSLNMSAEPTSSIYSTADSGFYSASECSTPPTPSMHSRGHFRFPSSTSSLSSSPPTHDAIEPPNSSGKLPKLTEEPIEREYDYGNDDSYRCSCTSLYFHRLCMHILTRHRRRRFLWPRARVLRVKGLRPRERLFHDPRHGATARKATEVTRSICAQHRWQV